MNSFHLHREVFCSTVNSIARCTKKRKLTTIATQKTIFSGIKYQNTHDANNSNKFLIQKSKTEIHRLAQYKCRQSCEKPDMKSSSKAPAISYNGEQRLTKRSGIAGKFCLFGGFFPDTSECQVAANKLSRVTWRKRNVISTSEPVTRRLLLHRYLVVLL